MKILFKKYLIVVISTCSIFFAACNNSDKELYDPTKKYEELGNITKPAYETKIATLEKQLFDSSSSFNQEKTAELMQSYLKYTSVFISDPKVPEYLFKAAGIARTVKLPTRSIELYTQIIKDYPEYEKKPEAMFLIAFVYDNDLNNKEMAKSGYKNFMSKFPDNQLSVDAKERLKTIDMTDEELIKMFEEKNNIKTDSLLN
jgi:Tetratricopeptide repeat